MPHHAIQPHHHHHIQTANPKKQQAVSPHTHTHCTHIPITSERTAQKPRTTWFCYQDDLLCQHLCVTDCVWIQAKISVLPLGSKKPGLPPLHWRTWGDSQLLLMWRNKLEQQKYIPILKYIYVYLHHKKQTFVTHESQESYIARTLLQRCSHVCDKWFDYHVCCFDLDIEPKFWTRDRSDPAKNSQSCLQQQQAVDTLTSNLPWWPPREWMVKVDISPHVQALYETSTLQRKRATWSPTHLQNHQHHMIDLKNHMIQLYPKWLVTWQLFVNFMWQIQQIMSKLVKGFMLKELGTHTWGRPVLKSHESSHLKWSTGFCLYSSAASSI